MNSEEIVKAANSTVYAFGEFQLEARNLLLLKNSEVVPLAPKACEVLLKLVSANGKLLTKQEILDEVWANTFVEEANLTHHVSALRKALGEDKNGRKFIETIPRRGYRFVAEIRKVTDSAAEIKFSEKITTRVVEEIEFNDAAISDAVPAELTPRAEPSALPKAKEIPLKTERRRRRGLLAGAAAIVLIGAIGFGIFKFSNPARIDFRAGKLTRLTSTGKTKLAAASPDGKFVAHVQETSDGQSLRIRQVAADAETQIIAAAKTEFRGLNFSSDSSRVYYIVGKTRFRGTLFQTPALGGERRKVLDDISLDNGVNGIGFSPDNRQIAFLRLSAPPGETSLHIADLDGANERVVVSYKRPNLVYGNPVWSPDGKIIACPFQTVSGMNILAINVSDNSARQVLPVDLSFVAQAAWLPDSQNLIFAAADESESALYQIWQIPLAGGTARRVNNDFNNYESVNLTADGRFLAAVRVEQVAHLWTMPSGGDANRLKQLTGGFEKYDGIYGIGWLPNNRLVYETIPSGKLGFAVIDSDGGNQKPLIGSGGYGAASPDGRFVVYQKYGVRDSRPDLGLFLFDTAEGSERRLTAGWDVFATFAPDGDSVIFTRWGDEAELATLWRVPTAGGEPAQLTNYQTITSAASPDRRFIALALWKGGKKQIVIISADGGAPLKIFDPDFQIQDRFGKRSLQWTSDGSGINFIREAGGVSNIWRQPFGGGEPAQITNFTSDLIFNFAFSPDGQQLALSRGTINSDVVLIENGK